MPYKSNNTNHQSKENKGNPATGGKPKGDPNSTPVNEDELRARLAEEYTNDGEADIPPHMTNNPNRNYDKPDLDKPAYS